MLKVLALSTRAWVWGHPPDTGNLPASTPLKKSIPPPHPRSHQLPITFWCRYNLLHLSPIYAGRLVGLVLYKSCAGNHSDLNLCHSQRPCFSALLSLSLPAVTFFPLLLLQCSLSLGEGWTSLSHLELNTISLFSVL